MKVTSTFNKTATAYNLNKRLIVNRGGTRSGKSYAILQLIFLIAYRSLKKRVITCVSHSFPHLEMGIVRDFDNILTGEGIDPDSVRTKRPYIYRIGNSIIEFISIDNIGKSLGAARDILFVNEANKISHAIYHQLMIRTTEAVFLDFNPDGEFWLHKQGYLKEADTAEITSTYLDNIENLTQAQINELSKAKARAAKEIADGKPGYWAYWWQVYGRGEIGRMVERLVFPNFIIVPDVIPKEYKSIGYGLDFGFSTDPTSMVELFKWEEKIIINELIYETGLINLRNDNLPNNSIQEVVEKLKIKKGLFIIAESAEPKSIAELRGVGLPMYAVKKKGIQDTIKQMHQYDLCVTESSVNTIKEFNNYMWPIDKNGDVIPGNPIGSDHSIDAIRYKLIMKNRTWK